MGRNKLTRFDFNEKVENVVQEGKDNFTTIAGNWHEQMFGNNHPITLEIGCGNGDYTIGIGEQFPERNCIGVDVKGSRIFQGAKKSRELNLKNVAFLRLRMHALEDLFKTNEVDEFWITFPDPRPRDRDIKRRLTHPRYLNHYRNISKPGTVVNLKTDNYDFYSYSLEVCKEEGLEILAQTDNLYESEHLELCLGIQTAYEKRYLEEGIKINYLRFKL